MARQTICSIYGAEQAKERKTRKTQREKSVSQSSQQADEEAQTIADWQTATAVEAVLYRWELADAEAAVNVHP